MDIRAKLKERLLEIPINYRAFREKHRLSNDLEIELKYIEPLLKELVDKKILNEKFKYCCPNCGNLITMDDKLLKEILNEEDGNCFLCDNCMNYFIDPIKNKTGYVYYDILDKEKLINWRDIND